MIIAFDSDIFYWRGPAPWFFVAMPDEQSRELREMAHLLTYGWGVIPVHVRIGRTAWTTSLIPKEGRYLVPIRADIRKAEALEEGDIVSIELEFDVRN